MAVKGSKGARKEKMVLIVISIPWSLNESLKIKADEQGISANDLFIKILEKYCPKKKTQKDI